MLAVQILVHIRIISLSWIWLATVIMKLTGPIIGIVLGCNWVPSLVPNFFVAYNKARPGICIFLLAVTGIALKWFFLPQSDNFWVPNRLMFPKSKQMSVWKYTHSVGSDNVFFLLFISFLALQIISILIILLVVSRFGQKCMQLNLGKGGCIFFSYKFQLQLM